MRQAATSRLHLTMRLSGRPQACPARRERNIAKRARGAQRPTHHGPLQPMVRRQHAVAQLVATRQWQGPTAPAPWHYRAYTAFRVSTKVSVPYH
jgi:hypothetical protein